MKVLIGLVLLVSAVGLAVVGALTHPEGPQVFVTGVEVGVVGMLGLRLVRGDVDRRLASHRLRLARDTSRRELAEALRARDDVDRGR